MVSGPKGGAKTRRLEEIYRQDGRGDGFISEAVERNGETVGYTLRRLRDGRVVPFAVPAEAPPSGWEEAFTHGHWSFSSAGMALAAAVVEEAVAAGVGPIYIDEIGKLELRGGGFSHLLRRLIDAGIDLVIAVRSVNVDPVVETFEITDYRVIEV